MRNLLCFIFGAALVLSLWLNLAPMIESNRVNHHILSNLAVLPNFSLIPWDTCEVVIDLSPVLDLTDGNVVYGGLAQLDCPTAIQQVNGGTNAVTDLRAFWEGYVLERNGDYEAALRRWRQYPTELGWYFFRLSEKDRAFRFNTALSLCRYVTQVDPTDLDAWQCMGESAVQLGDWATAEDAFVGKLEYQPNDPHTVFWLGRVYGMAGKDDKAIIWLTQAIEMTHDTSSLAAFAWYELGRVFQRQGQNDDALYAFRRTWDLAPSFLYIDYVKIRITELEQ